MPNDQEMPKAEMSEAEFKRHFGKPEFMTASDAKLLRVEADANGRYWAFFEVADNWAWLPYAARAKVNGRSISLAVRLFWSDEERPPVQSGDLRVIGATELAKTTGFKPIQLKVGPPIYAVELPFQPDSINVVDQ